MAFQIFKIVRSIRSEQLWLAQFKKENPIDIVISDNRYGLFLKGLTSIFISHQLSPAMPFGRKLISKLLQKKVNSFSECWIPDFKEATLSGKLSDHKLKIPAHFIGPLARFKLKQVATPQYDELFIVSGPPPSSNIFLSKIINYAKMQSKKVCIISTLKYNHILPNHISLIVSPSKETMENTINNSKLIIGKSGYTSIMEFYNQKKPTIFTPTKGQYEQIYLSERHQSVNTIKNHPHLFKFITSE